MFKKIIALILSSLLILSVAGCASNNADLENPSADPTEENTTSAPETTENQSIEVDENLLTVDIVFPASFFEGQDMEAFDTDTYAQEQGFISARINEDGSLTATMTKRKYRDLLAETAASLESSFAEYANSQDAPYIKEITHNEDFTSVTMKVDRASYENAFDMTPFGIAISVAMYQIIAQIEVHVEIVMVDANTGDTINTIVYPDALEG